MDITTALLESWDRQCRIVNAVASLVNEENKEKKPSEDGMPLYAQLAHIHGVRRYWLSQIDPERGKALETTFDGSWDKYITDLPKIKALLGESAKAVRDSVEDLIKNDVGARGGYDNPVLFLQHMVWHEGWHVGLIFLALRLNGQDPGEEWEEPNVWGEWRTEE